MEAKDELTFVESYILRRTSQRGSAGGVAAAIGKPRFVCTGDDPCAKRRRCPGYTPRRVPRTALCATPRF